MGTYSERNKYYEDAERFIDLLFPLFPPKAKFELEILILNSDLDEKKLAAKISTIIYELLVMHGYAAEASASDLRLTDVGRTAQNLGGHFKYEEKIKKLNERTERKEIVDLNTKEWIFKTRLIPYGVSLLAVAISIASYFRPSNTSITQKPKQPYSAPLPRHEIELLVDSLLKTRHK